MCTVPWVATTLASAASASAGGVTPEAGPAPRRAPVGADFAYDQEAADIFYSAVYPLKPLSQRLA